MSKNPSIPESEAGLPDTALVTASPLTTGLSRIEMLDGEPVCSLDVGFRLIDEFNRLFPGGSQLCFDSEIRVVDNSLNRNDALWGPIFASKGLPVNTELSSLPEDVRLSCIRLMFGGLIGDRAYQRPNFFVEARKGTIRSTADFLAMIDDERDPFGRRFTIMELDNMRVSIDRLTERMSSRMEIRNMFPSEFPEVPELRQSFRKKINALRIMAALPQIGSQITVFQTSGHPIDGEDVGELESE